MPYSLMSRRSGAVKLPFYELSSHVMLRGGIQEQRVSLNCPV